LSQPTRNSLTSKREAILAQESGVWRDAAVSLWDSVKADWLCSLAGLRQSLEMRFDDGINEYLPVIMRPSLESIEGLKDYTRSPTEHRADLESTLIRIATEADSLDAALSRYYDQLGYLPLCSELSIVRLIDEWQARHGRVAQLWNVIWDWAEKVRSPLARYHACTVFAVKPVHVPSDQVVKLWEEIAQVVQRAIFEEPSKQGQLSWQLRTYLAQHFCRHIECQVPWQDGERISVLSWWAAERVANLFDTSAETVTWFRDKVLSQEAELTYRIWHFAHAPVVHSGFRYATLFVPSVWSVSLQCQLGNLVSAMEPSSMREKDAETVETAIKAAILGALTLQEKPIEQRVYAFESMMLSVAELWADRWKNVRPQEAMGAYVGVFRQLTRSEGLEESLRRVTKEGEAGQMIIAHYLRAMAFMGVAPPDPIWNCLGDVDWRDTLFRETHPKALEMIMSALDEIAVSKGDKWAWEVPHLVAAACEKAEDPERQKQLFAHTILSSLAADITSPIRRLARGGSRHKLIEEVAFWRDRITEIRDLCPPWLQARFRAMMAALNVA
jgi:hypothetical protein